MTESKRTKIASGTASSASAIAADSVISFAVPISAGKALALALRATWADFFFCLGLLLVGFGAMEAVQADAVVTTHRTSVAVFFLYCCYELC